LSEQGIGVTTSTSVLILPVALIIAAIVSTSTIRRFAPTAFGLATIASVVATAFLWHGSVPRTRSSSPVLSLASNTSDDPNDCRETATSLSFEARSN
jgi:hypothetical protein